MHLHGPAEKRGSADQREQTALGSPVDKLPPASQLGVPLVFFKYINYSRRTQVLHNLVDYSTT